MKKKKKETIIRGLVEHGANVNKNRPLIVIFVKNKNENVNIIN